MGCKGLIRGSSSYLFFAEEHEYGIPDWNYGGTEYQAIERINAGEGGTGSDHKLTFKHTVADTAAAEAAFKDRWIAVFSGGITPSQQPGTAEDDSIDLIQAFKVASAVKSGDNVELTLSDKTLPRFSLRKGDKIRVLDATDPFRKARVRAVPGLVSSALSAEIGEIQDESLALAGAQEATRLRGESRRGGITGDGGSFVVQPGTRGYASLLRHALGAKVYYNQLKGVPVSSAATTTVRADAEADASSLGVVDESNFAVGDVVRVGPNANGDYDYVAVSALVATVGSEALTLGNKLAFDHASGEAVVEVTGNHINHSDGYKAGAIELVLDSRAGFSAGDRVRIGNGNTSEVVTLGTHPTGSGNTQKISFPNHPLNYEHDDNEVVIKVESGVIPHELRKGDLPCSMTVYQWADAIGALWIVSGVKIGSYDLSAANEDSTIKSTFNTVVRTAQLLEELPFTRPISVKHEPYVNFELALNRTADGETRREVGLNSVTINGDNEITPLKAINPAGTYGSAGEGVGRWSADFNYQLTNVTRFKEVVEGTQADWDATISYDVRGRTEEIKFEFPNSTITGNILPSIEDAGVASADGTLLTGQHDTKGTNVVCTVLADEGRI